MKKDKNGRLIVIRKSTKLKLDKRKLVGTESYNSVISRLLKGVE
jgi:hypothetical protein